ncbi:MAG: hypothetical protein RL404_1716 [Pseudomonadota bacterium]
MALTTRSTVANRTRPAAIAPAADTFQRALKQHQQGELVDAEAGYKAVIRREPKHLHANYLLGLLYSQTERPHEAIRQISGYLKGCPNDAQAISALALAYFDIDDFERAAQLLERSLGLNANAPHTWYNLGKARFALARHESAIAAYAQALQMEPGYADAAIGKAIAEREAKLYDKAEQTLAAAIVHAPMEAGLHFHYGNVMRDLHAYEAAHDAYGATLALDPHYRDAWVNYATTCKDLDQTAEALDAYDRALAIDPAHAEANYNKSLVLLSNLHLDAGWKLYDKRLTSEVSVQRFVGGQRVRVAPDWDRRSVPASLLVMGEQGLGDQLFFASMLAELAAQVPGATVCVDPRLVPLLQRSYPALRFIDGAQIDAQSFDAQIYLGSLGGLYRPDISSLERVPSAYLRADAQRSAALRKRIRRDGRLTCGLSWVSRNEQLGAGKSLTLEALLPALAHDGIDFIDLQYGDHRAERDAFEAAHGIQIQHLDDVDCTHDIDGLAALTDACDLVLTVSNTTAHLAGALGKPTIVMLPDAAARLWYWPADGLKSPWYPSACLFHKSGERGWDNVVDAVALTLLGIH